MADKELHADPNISDNELCNETAADVESTSHSRITGKNCRNVGSPAGFFKQMQVSRDSNRQTQERGISLEPIISLMNDYAASCEDTFTVSEYFSKWQSDRAIDYFVVAITDYALNWHDMKVLYEAEQIAKKAAANIEC